jgi:glycosyltransferase involved in cell wall biosynthesis
MPVYNRENSVRHAIQSILDQTYENWELIIVNDGSTDNTETVIKLFKDSRIRYFKNKTNRGISFSRNFGNSKARGKIITVQDSDDMSLPDRFEWIVDAFKKPIDILYHWFYIRAVDIRFGARAIHRELHRCGEYDRKRALTIPYIPGLLAYKREVAKKCPYRESLKCWDDWGFVVDCTMAKFRFYNLERALYEYVLSEDSITMASEHNGMREKDKQTLKDILRKEYKFTVQ